MAYREIVREDGDARYVVANAEDRVQPLYRGTQAVWYIYGALAALLSIRFLLKLLGANQGAGFTDFVNTLSAPFVQPFVYVFGVTNASGAVIEWASLLAILVYGLIAYGIIQLLAMSRPVPRYEAREGLEVQDNTSPISHQVV
jgi:hypothetical protein